MWNELENLRLPTAGPMFEHFQNDELQVQLLMNQSMNLVEIKKSAAELKDALRRYRNEISDDPARVAASFGVPQPPANQHPFLALLQEAPFGRRIRIPPETVPPEYWNGIPPELQKRLQRLTREEDIIEEMRAYAAEEIEILSASGSNGTPPTPANAPNSALTPQPERQLKPPTTNTGKL